MATAATRRERVLITEQAEGDAHRQHRPGGEEEQVRERVEVLPVRRERGHRVQREHGAMGESPGEPGDKAVGRATKTPVVDVDRIVTKDLDHFRDDSHVTPRATELEADAVFAAIEATGLIERWQARHRGCVGGGDRPCQSTEAPPSAV